MPDDDEGRAEREVRRFDGAGRRPPPRRGSRAGPDRRRRAPPPGRPGGGGQAQRRRLLARGGGGVVGADAPVHETDGAWVFARTGLTEAVTAAGGEMRDLALEPKVEVQGPGGTVVKTMKGPKVGMDA